MNKLKVIAPIIYLTMGLLFPTISYGSDPLLPANKIQALDMIFLPVSGWFEHIEPQIDAWGKCDAAQLAANDKYADRMNKVITKLAQDVLRLLPTTDEGAKLYQLEIEYNRKYWAHRGYMLGVAKGLEMPLEEIADAQAEECIRAYLD